MKIKHKLFIPSLIVLFFISMSYADNTPSLGLIKEKLQKVVNNYYRTYSQKERFTAISASVFIPHNKQAGANDIITVVKGTKGIPPLNQLITPDDLFEIGSITKSFTALILLQLQIEDKLSLDDPLGKWLPQYPHWQKVTLRQLLNMTSSIPNYSANPEFEKQMDADLSRVWTNEDLLSYAHPEQPLKINKDKLYEYSNSNYILAALVIEKVTHDTFKNQLKKRILQDNNLQNTFYPVGAGSTAVQKAIYGRRIHGYFYDKNAKKLIDTFTSDLSWAGAAGAIIANTDNVIRWVQLLYHGILMTPQSREKGLNELETLVSTKTGQPIVEVSAEHPMGFGLGVAAIYDKQSNQRFWFYEGSTLGFRVMYLWSPCNDVTTAIALNSKAGEGSPDSKIGDHIHEANLNLYHSIMKEYPELRCKN